MPGVSPPSDGGYNYYQRSISELEDELRKEAKKRKEGQDEYIQDLEHKYQTARAKDAEETADTIRRVRENAMEANHNDRENAKREIDTLKKQTYDKYGRYNGNEADVMKQQLDNTVNDYKVQQERNRKAIQSLEDGFDNKMAQQKRDHENELEKVVNAARDSAKEDYTRSYQDERMQYDDFKKKTEENYNKLNQERMEDMNFQRRRAEEAMNETKNTYEKRLRTQERADSNRMQSLQRAHLIDQETAARNASESRAIEVRGLRDQLKEVTDHAAQYKKDLSAGTADAVREFENDWRMREKLVMDSYEMDKAKLKQQNTEAERYADYNLHKNLSDKDRYFTKLIESQVADSRMKEKDLQETFMRDRNQLEIQMKRDHILAEKARESQLEEAYRQRDVALQNQGKAYQGTLTRQRQSDQQIIDQLQKEILYKSTSEDTSVISPAAEAAVRKQVIKEYGKNLDTEVERNKNATDSMQRNYSNLLKETIQDRDHREAQIQRNNSAERQHERSELLEHIRDIEFTRDNSIRNKDMDSAREQDNLTRNYSTMIERQRREFDATLQASKDDASAKLSATRQEAEFNSRMAQRAFADRENELVREYNKRLADQKTELTTVAEDAKHQTQQAIREGERRTKQALEEQGRSYEQRIAQIEAQHKERERYINQNFQDEMEKLKRSHAIALSKKS